MIPTLRSSIVVVSLSSVAAARDFSTDLILPQQGRLGDGESILT